VVSAFARGANRTRIVIYATLGNRLVFDPERLEALRRAALARQLVLFGTGPAFRVSPAQNHIRS
jgi:hypothetical protein